MKNSQTSGWILPFLLGAVLLVINALLYTQLFLQTTNTLENNDRWQSTKASLKRGVIGGVAYVITPVALHRSQLNLGALFGFQELITREKFDPLEISFDLRLPDSSYMTFLYNLGPAGSSGLRLSRNPHYENAHLVIQPEGRFLKKEPFEVKNWKEGTNQIKFIFGEDQTSVSLNDQPLGQFMDSLSNKTQIGFRGGPFEAAVDNVRIQERDGTIFHEAFQNRTNFVKPFAFIFSLLLSVNGLILYGARRKSRINPSIKVFHYVLTANLLLLLLQPILYVGQYICLSKFTSLSKLYFKAAVALRSIPSTIETRKEAVERLEKEVSQNPPEDRYRILFIGTSQTWGAGVDSIDETFVKRLENSLNQKNPGQPVYEIINGGISGERAPSLFELYEKEWIGWRPQAVAINLSNNDMDSSKFSEAMEKFVQLNKSKNIQTILILEPNTVEALRSNLPANHQILRDLSQRRQVPLVDLQSCLAQKHDEGFLWWDFVHLSRLGQKMAAECLMGPFEEILNSRKRTLSSPPPRGSLSS